MNTLIFFALMPHSRTMPQVMVISSEGYFYSYNIDLENGGECTLTKQYRYIYIYSLRVYFVTTLTTLVVLAVYLIRKKTRRNY